MNIRTYYDNNESQITAYRRSYLENIPYIETYLADCIKDTISNIKIGDEVEVVFIDSPLNVDDFKIGDIGIFMNSFHSTFGWVKFEHIKEWQPVDLRSVKLVKLNK